MIQSKTKRIWMASDGTEHDAMEKAQIHDIALLLTRIAESQTGHRPNDSQIATFLVDNSPAVLDILLTDGRRRKRLGKSAGRKAKVAKAMEKVDEVLGGIKAMKEGQ